MTAFIESQFPTNIPFQFSGGPAYNTTVNITKSGFETRNVNWTKPRHKYIFNYGSLPQADYDNAKRFFHACQGRAIGFRFKDWNDYKSCGIDDAVSAVDQIVGTGNGVSTVLQLIKKYTVASTTLTRVIKKPVAGTVLIALNGTPTTAFTVDTATGLVTMTSPPGIGVTVTCGFHFDTPCRFDMDEMLSQIINVGACNTSITLIEDMNA